MELPAGARHLEATMYSIDLIPRVLADGPDAAFLVGGAKSRITTIHTGRYRISILWSPRPSEQI